MRIEFRPYFNVGKVKCDLPERIRNRLIGEVGQFLPNEMKYPYRKQVGIYFIFRWNGFTSFPRNRKWFPRLRFPFVIRTGISSRTIYLIDGKWQEALQLGWIVREEIGIAVANSVGVNRMTIGG